MDNTVGVPRIRVVPLISSGCAAFGCDSALLLNYRGFASIDSCFVSLERRLDLMQLDMKNLNKTMTALEIDVAQLKDKVG